ncbi:catalase family protein [Floridanema evergladense]|uniref:Catalase family protein n=1 Tax=Floridaenema evergladense BLCC-F167 TaxID=3153639 RepID=A0ABV4WNJ4_9CYAN
MANQTYRLELYQEYPLPNEEAAIEEIAKIAKEMMQKDYPEGKRPARRDQHAKDHGCVRGEFIIEADLPEELRVGVFREPRTYPIWIRFSNSSPKCQHDSQADIHGMAIKLMGVAGEKILSEERFETTQDFLLIDYPIFFFANVQDCMQLFTNYKKGELIKFFFPSFNPFKWRLKELIIAQVCKQKITNLLDRQYWSVLPYKFGSRAVKYSVKPHVINFSNKSVISSENYLREGLIRHLKNQEVGFDFMIQFQTDPDKMPIEDPRVRWDEKLSPFQKIATIRIPPQTFDSDEQREFCENLSYTPWHSLPEHKPLGGLNRIRQKVYPTISKLRHQMNNASTKEPSA